MNRETKTVDEACMEAMAEIRSNEEFWVISDEYGYAPTISLKEKRRVNAWLAWSNRDLLQDFLRQKFGEAIPETLKTFRIDTDFGRHFPNCMDNSKGIRLRHVTVNPACGGEDNDLRTYAWGDFFGKEMPPVPSSYGFEMPSTETEQTVKAYTEKALADMNEIGVMYVLQQCAVWDDWQMITLSIGMKVGDGRVAVIPVFSNEKRAQEYRRSCSYDHVNGAEVKLRTPEDLAQDIEEDMDNQITLKKLIDEKPLLVYVNPAYDDSFATERMFPPVEFAKRVDIAKHFLKKRKDDDG